MNFLKLSFWTLFGLALTSYILAFLCIIVSPKFNEVPKYLMFATILLGYIPGKEKRQSEAAKIVYSLVYPVLWGALALLLCFFLTLGNTRERHEEYLSPNGEYIIVIEYDFVSAPHLYRKINSVFMTRQQIPGLFGGINETYPCSLEWLSNDTFLLSRYPDEKPVIYQLS